MVGNGIHYSIILCIKENFFLKVNSEFLRVRRSQAREKPEHNKNFPGEHTESHGGVRVDLSYCAFHIKHWFLCVDTNLLLER